MSISVIENTYRALECSSVGFSTTGALILANLTTVRGLDFYNLDVFAFMQRQSSETTTAPALNVSESVARTFSTHMVGWNPTVSIKRDGQYFDSVASSAVSTLENTLIPQKSKFVLQVTDNLSGVSLLPHAKFAVPDDLNTVVRYPVDLFVTERAKNADSINTFLSKTGVFATNASISSEVDSLGRKKKKKATTSNSRLMISL